MHYPNTPTDSFLHFLMHLQDTLEHIYYIEATPHKSAPKEYTISFTSWLVIIISYHLFSASNSMLCINPISRQTKFYSPAYAMPSSWNCRPFSPPVWAKFVWIDFLTGYFPLKRSLITFSTSSENSDFQVWQTNSFSFQIL